MEDGNFQIAGDALASTVELAGDTLGVVPVFGVVPTAAGQIAEGAIHMAANGAQVVSDLAHGEILSAAGSALELVGDAAYDTVTGVASTAASFFGLGAVNVAIDGANIAKEGFDLISGGDDVVENAAPTPVHGGSKGEIQIS